MKARLIFLAVVLAGCSVPLPPSRTTQAPPPPRLENEPPPLAESSKRVPPPVYAAPKAPEPSPVQAAPAAAPKAPQPSPKTAAPPKAAAPPKQAAAPAATPAAPAPAHPPLDLHSLEQRLRDTSAIGVLTKLSLKNQVDDLIDRFRNFHAGQRPPTLAELKPAFELLLMKVLSLLQDHDKTLASDINASRDAIWGVLADRDKLSQFVN